MRIKMLIAATAIAVSTALVPSASAADRAPTKVTIKALGGGEFTGKVKSEDADCVSERKVTLYKLTGATPNRADDEKIVSDTTEDNGQWNTGQTGERKGKFYVRVKKTDDCRGAISKVVKATP